MGKEAYIHKQHNTLILIRVIASPIQEIRLLSTQVSSRLYTHAKKEPVISFYLGNTGNSNKPTHTYTRPIYTIFIRKSIKIDFWSGF